MKVYKFLLGRPIASQQIKNQYLPKWKALPILAADALSSVAYGTEEIIKVLVSVSPAALSLLLPISVVIVLLIGLLAASYWQTIHHYPNGGGAFTVATDNLGKLPGLLAAVALLVDYILTVAVSVSASIYALSSAFPFLQPYSVILAISFILFLTYMNLRGVYESGTIFALPTTFFIITMGILFIVAGIDSIKAFGYPLATATIPDYKLDMYSFSIMVFLRAFAAGCSALTGIESIANSISVFRPPQVKNAAKTLLVMVTLLSALFFGISYLAQYYHITPSSSESVLSKLGHIIFGYNPLYYALQISTFLVLLLAANTPFTGFPRLASILSQQGFLPKQLSNLGDRLSFSNGIVLLATLSIILIFCFKADTHRLIPLYSVGVFLAFSLLQLGMLVRFYKKSDALWKIIANALGFIATTLALIVIIKAKFTYGAWLVVVAMPLILFIFYKIKRHYQEIERELSIDFKEAYDCLNKVDQDKNPRIILPVSKIHRGTLTALNFARSISTDIIAVTVETDVQATLKLQAQWKELNIAIPLIVLASPYRSTIRPLTKFIKSQDKLKKGGNLCIVVLPRAVLNHWWQNLLHNQRAALLKTVLLYDRKNKGHTRIIVDVPYPLVE